MKEFGTTLVNNASAILGGFALVITAIVGYLTLRDKRTVTYEGGLEKYVVLLQKQVDDNTQAIEAFKIERADLVSQINRLTAQGIIKDQRIATLEGQVLALQTENTNYKTQHGTTN